MSFAPLNKSLTLRLVITLQFATLLTYLNLNIINVGDMGTALPLLVFFIGLSSLLFVIFWLSKKLYFRIHLVFFFLLISWVAFRIILDLSDVPYLKQLTVATTGGMLFFYIIGALLGLTSHSVLRLRSDVRVEIYIIILFSILSVWMLYSFSQRLHDSLFYLQDINGGYQRPGNFLSISFIIVSFAYLSLVLKRIAKGAITLLGFIVLCVYTLSTFMALLGSQLFGSNSATAVILGVYLITLVMSLIIPKKTNWLNYLKHKLVLPWSKRLVKDLFVMALLGLVIFFGILALIISITGFDITGLRLLGFGSASNTSLITRIDILLETGANQLSFAPFLGNMNVAYLTTGHAGRTLHSFFPFVIANLGLVGLFIVLILFASVFFQLYRESKMTGIHDLDMYHFKMAAIYSMFILLYILLFANLATGISWSVLWFTLGFISKPFGFK